LANKVGAHAPLGLVTVDVIERLVGKDAEGCNKIGPIGSRTSELRCPVRVVPGEGEN